MTARWNHQRWGRATDLIHQSDMYGLIGKYGCPEQFRRKKIEALEGKRVYESADGKLCSGTAVHAVKHRILKSPPAVEAMLAPDQVFASSTLERGFNEEFERERAGRAVNWYGKADAEKHKADCVAMLTGSMADMINHVGEVVAVECGFVFHVDGIWLTGSVDLIYRSPGSLRLSFADWKTGAQKPHQIDLDHGWQSAIYAEAMKHGYFVRYENVDARDGEEHRDALERVCGEIAVAWQTNTEAQKIVDEAGDHDARHQLALAAESLDRVLAKHSAERFGEFPERIRYVHLRDYIPYVKATTRMLDRPEEIEWAGLKEKGKVKFLKGDARGPAWYRVNRSEADAPRLRHLLRAVVSWVRFGRFPAAPGEMCSRCRFRQPCLLDGYKPIGEERRKLDHMTREFDFDGLDDEL